MIKSTFNLMIRFIFDRVKVFSCKLDATEIVQMKSDREKGPQPAFLFKDRCGYLRWIPLRHVGDERGNGFER